MPCTYSNSQTFEIKETLKWGGGTLTNIVLYNSNIYIFGVCVAPVFVVILINFFFSVVFGTVLTGQCITLGSTTNNTSVLNLKSLYSSPLSTFNKAGDAFLYI